MLDKDADGFLSVEELRGGAEIFGHAWGEEELRLHFMAIAKIYTIYINTTIYYIYYIYTIYNIIYIYNTIYFYNRMVYF